MKLRDILMLSTESVTPNPDIFYNLYSLPSFDEGKTPELSKGVSIMSNKYLVPDKCILFNKLNVRFKRVWRINNRFVNKIASTEFLPLIIDESIVDFNYAYYLLISDSLTNFLCGQNSNTSGSHKRIDPTSFLDINITLPSREEQEKIGSLLGDIDAKIAINQEINRNLHLSA